MNYSNWSTSRLLRYFKMTRRRLITAQNAKGWGWIQTPLGEEIKKLSELEAVLREHLSKREHVERKP
jgi:hypothetical protein